jgi:hypothetical protein
VPGILFGWCALQANAPEELQYFDDGVFIDHHASPAMSEQKATIDRPSMMPVMMGKKYVSTSMGSSPENRKAAVVQDMPAISE